MNRHTLEILHGSAISFVLKVLGALFQFIMTLVISRKLGAASAGLFFLALTIVNILAVVARFGSDNYLVKKVSELNAIGDTGLCIDYIDKVLWIVLIASSICAVCLWVFSPLLSVHLFHKPQLKNVLEWMSLLVIALSTAMTMSFALQGFKKIMHSVTIQNVITPLGIIVFTIVLIPFYGINGAIFAYGLSLMSALTYAWFTLSVVRKKFAKTDRRETLEWKTIWSESRSFYVISIMNQVIAWTPLLLSGVFLESADVGIYQGAYRTAFLVSFMQLAMTSIIAPKLAEFRSLGKYKLLEETTAKFTFIALLASLPVVVTLLLFSDEILKIFGHEYVGGSEAIKILVIGQFINIFVGPVMLLLSMTGHVDTARKVVIVSAIVAVTMSLFFIPMFGLIGTAIASAATLGFQNIYAAISVKKCLGFFNVPRPTIMGSIFGKAF